jgi:hypothetical protein
LILSLLLACCLPASETPQTTVDPVVPTPTTPTTPAAVPVTVTIAEKDYPFNGNQELGVKSVTVHYAVATVADPAIQAAINALLAPESACGADCAPGDYDEWAARVVWNADGVLQVAYDVEYIGAYPSQFTFHVPVDVATGKRITTAEAFGADTSGLRSKIDAELAKLRARHEADIKREIPDVTADDPLMTSLVDAHIGEEELASFELDPAGIKFEHDYGTPHVALALLPPDPVTLDWATVGPLVNPTGPLAAAAQRNRK